MTDSPTTPASVQPTSSSATATGNIELRTKTQSKILSVSLYAAQAEITRSYKLDVAPGLNQVVILGLPNTMQMDSIRVEGKGSATIHDVTVSFPSPLAVATTSEALQDLLEQKERSTLALQRAQLAIKSLETYLGTFDSARFQADMLSTQIDNYESVASKLDEKIVQLKKDGTALDVKIDEERRKIGAGASQDEDDKKAGMKATIGVFSKVQDPVELILIYAVTSASWSAAYDVRVAMNSKENTMTMLYKAVVSHSTGEDWNDVPLTLETASPSFGLTIPTLEPWNLALNAPPLKKYKTRGMGSVQLSSAAPMSRSRVQEEYSALRDSYDPTIEDSYNPTPMGYREVDVTSQGTVNATFGVPGLVSVPSDGEAHTFTIASLDLRADLSWICVPRKDTKVHLKANVLNSSEYTLLPGPASIYVDGSFISKSTMAAVSPQEKFDYSLGLDPSIRVTYHPRATTLSQSGFYNKTTTSVYTQRITIHNTKSVRADKVKIIDQIPVSEHSDIVVKLDTPSLPAPSSGTVNKLKSSAPSPSAPVKVGEKITAQWEVEEDVEYAVPGKDGKMSWMCSVSAQDKVSMVLKWEVTSPAHRHVYGL